MYPIKNSFINKFAIMGYRLDNPEASAFKLFVVDKWNDFIFFIRDILERPDLLDIKDSAKTYEGGYKDPCDKYLYASFAILADFVENEMYNSYTDWEDASMIDVAKEIEALYTWWTIDRLKEDEEYSALLHKLYRFDGRNLEEVIKRMPVQKTDAERARLEEIEEKPQIMLERLTKIRQCLWT